MRCLAFVGACVLVGGTAVHAAEPYRAAGHSPEWTLEIGSDTILRERLRPTIAVPTPTAAADYNGTRYDTTYEGAVLSVSIQNRPCLFDRVYYPNTVRVQQRRRVLRGCGGYSGKTDQLTDTRWLLTWIERFSPEQRRVLEASTEAPAKATPMRLPFLHRRRVKQVVLQEHEPRRTISKRKLKEASAPTLVFSQGRASGRAGCNGFGATYALAGRELRFGNIVTTRMTCLDTRRTALESDYVALLGQPLVVRPNGDDLTVIAANNMVAHFERVR